MKKIIRKLMRSIPPYARLATVVLTAATAFCVVAIGLALFSFKPSEAEAEAEARAVQTVLTADPTDPSTTSTQSTQSAEEPVVKDVYKATLTEFHLPVEGFTGRYATVDVEFIDESGPVHLLILEKVDGEFSVCCPSTMDTQKAPSELGWYITRDNDEELTIFITQEMFYSDIF